MIIGLGHKAQVGKDTTADIINFLINNSFENNPNILTREYLAHRSLKEKKECRFAVKKFADKLKYCTSIILGCTVDQLEDPAFKESILGEEWWLRKIYRNNNIEYIPYRPDNQLRGKDELIKMTPRMFMERFGTDAGRNNIHANIWVNATMNDVYDNTILTDVRFPNEAEAIKSRGGILINVDRLICYKCGNTTDFNYGSFKTSSIKTLACESCGYEFSKAHESETALDEYTKWDFTIDNNSDFEHLVTQIREILIELNIIK